MALFIIALLGAAALPAAPPSPVGLWKTVDDRTHRPRGTVRIYENNGVFSGRIETTFDLTEVWEHCAGCEGDRHNRPVLGLEILRGMKKTGSEFSGGDILDPETGVVYRCRMWLEDSGRRLVVRGFIGFALFGRSQTWSREE